MVDSLSGLIPDAFRLDVQRVGTQVLIAVGGDLDMATAPHLRAAIDRALAGGATRLVLDLRDLDFMDSTGIAECCRVDALAREHALDLQIVRGRPTIQRVFALTALDGVLPFVDAPPGTQTPG